MNGCRYPTQSAGRGRCDPSFNPVYGQGMSSAALQIKALAQILDSRAAESRGLEGLAPEFFRKAAGVIDTPWGLAANFDFAYPQTEGERPKGRQQDANYFAALDSLQSEDIEVQRLVAEVFQLTKPRQMLSRSLSGAVSSSNFASWSA